MSSVVEPPSSLGVMRWHRFAPMETTRRMKMTRTVFAMAVAAFLLAVGGGTSQAAPIAPLASVGTSDNSLVTPVWWYRHHYYRHRHCWRGRYGHVHCRW